MFSGRKNKKNKMLKDKINQFIDTFEDKLDTNVDLVNQKAKENVLNDRKIYNYLVELAGLKCKKYILPNDFNKIQNIFIDLREDKIEQAKSKMICTNAHSVFYSIDFDTFYDGLAFKYKNKLIEHYKNIKNELFSKGFINPYFTSATPSINGTMGIDSATYIDSTISINNADLIEAGFIPSGKSPDGYSTYTYNDPHTNVLTTVTIDSDGHILDKQVYTQFYTLYENLYKDLYKDYTHFYKEIKKNINDIKKKYE